MPFHQPPVAARIIGAPAAIGTWFGHLSQRAARGAIMAATLGALSFGSGCAIHGVGFSEDPMQARVARVAGKLADVGGGDLTAKIERRVKAKIGALALTKHGGDVQSLFNAYSRPTGLMQRDDFERMLDDAYVGNNTFDRRVIAKIAFDHLDRDDGNRDGALSWEELSSKLPSFLRNNHDADDDGGPELSDLLHQLLSRIG